jgi:hypothetical protein
MTSPEEEQTLPKSHQSSGTELADELIATREAYLRQQEANRAHVEQLSTDTEIAQTKQLFDGAKLLARAMNPPRPDRHAKLTFDSWDWEISKLEEGELTSASSTLLVPDQGTRLYTNKIAGFLMDSDNAVIHHVAASDSGSSGTGDDFSANPPDFETLPQLAGYARAHQSDEMNEINADFSMASVRGLFAKNAPQAKLEALAAQRHIITQQGYDIPLFVYNEKGRSLESWKPSDEEINTLLDQMGSPTVREIFRNSLNR